MHKAGDVHTSRARRSSSTQVTSDGLPLVIEAMMPVAGSSPAVEMAYMK